MGGGKIFTKLKNIEEYTIGLSVIYYCFLSSFAHFTRLWHRNFSLI